MALIREHGTQDYERGETMKKLCFALALLILLVLGISPVFAQIYKWVDEKGTIHFTQDPSTIPEKYRGTARSRPSEEEPAPTGERVRSREYYERTPKERLGFEGPPERSDIGRKETSEAKEETSAPSPGYIPFNKFKYLQERMTEAEVLSRFGSPTRETRDEAKTRGNIHGYVDPAGAMTGTMRGKTVVIKRYYYIGDKSKGEKTTIIHFENGKVVRYERI